MKWLTLLLLLVISVPMSSAQSSGVRVQGIGTLSCGKYLEMRKERNANQDGATVSWVWGYMAGFNMEAQQPTTKPSPDQSSTLAYVDKYCRDHPLETVLLASMALVHELGGVRNPR